MSATTNSWVLKPTPGTEFRSFFLRALNWLAFGLLTFGLITNVLAQTNSALEASAVKKDFAARARQSYLAARSRLQTEPANVEAAWQFGRACFDWAEFAADNSQREQIANEGIAACRKAIEQSPNSAAAHYYLGMNLGQVAQVKRLGALKLVGEMESEFKKTGQLDERFDFAGPARNLGLLYRDAPGWPVSVGNRGKARQFLARAVELSPHYPENRLNLAESYLKWNERGKFQHEIRTIEDMLPRARSEFSGERWEAGWIDWQRRWEHLKTKAAEMPAPAESPKAKQDAP